MLSGVQHGSLKDQIRNVPDLRLHFLILIHHHSNRILILYPEYEWQRRWCAARTSGIISSR